MKNWMDLMHTHERKIVSIKYFLFFFIFQTKKVYVHNLAISIIVIITLFKKLLVDTTF